MPSREQLLLEAQHARAQLESEQAFLTRLLEALPYPVSYIDADLIYRRCNSAAAATVGRTPDQIIGQSVASVVGPESEVVALLQGVLSSSEPYRGIVGFSAPGSTSPATYQVSYLPDKDEEGRTVGVLTNAVDVTDVVESRRAQRESDERLRLVLEAAGFGAFDFNVETGETYWDERQRELWGIPADVKVDYQEVLSRVHPDDRERTARTFEEALSPDGEGIYDCTYRILGPDGSERWLAARGLALFQGKGRDRQAVRMIGVERDVTDARQVEDALREGEERYKQLFESESDAILLIDQETGRILEANTAADVMYGYDAGELQGLTDVDLSAEPQLTRASAHPTSAGGNVVVPIRRHRRKEGSVFAVEITGRIFSLHGRPVRIAAVRDVSERIRAEEALRESEELYRSILRASPDDVTVTDVQGKVLLVSPAAVSMLGYGREEDLLGRSMLEFLVPKDRARFEASIALMHEGVSSGPGDYAAVRADGSTFPIEVNGEFIRDADGRPTGMVFVVRDVTQRRRADKALRESEERFRMLFEGHRAVMLVIEPDSGQILDANAAAVRFYGYSREQLRSMHIEQINQLPPEEVAAERQRAMGHGKEVFAFPHRLASGEVRTVEVYSTPVTLQGRPTLFSIIHDVTARKQAEEALRESEAERAAHEERARLARDLHDSVTQALFAATLKAEALTIASADSSDGAAAAEEVRRLSRGALAEMRTLLLELRGDPVEAVPLPQLLRNVVEAAESRAGVKVSLTLGEEPALPAKVHEAVYRITQEALNNVVRHAKASNAWVQLDGDASHVRLVIGDDGRGFDPASVDPGHFGLKSMRERAGDSGGRLAVRSVPGEGTVLTVEWRLEEPGLE